MFVLTSKQKISLFIALNFVLVTAILALPKQFQVFYMATPIVSALLILFIFTKEGYTRSFFRDTGLWPVGIRLSFMSFIVPVVVLTASMLIYKLFFPEAVRIPGNLTQSLLYVIGLSFYQTVTFSLAEEFGWRGYLLPKMLSEIPSRIKASIAVGFIWAFWHYPLIIMGGYGAAGNLALTLPLFTILVLLLSIITGELRVRSRSVWPASWFHSVHNTMWGFWGQFAASGGLIVYLSGEYGLFTIGLYAVIVLYILVDIRRRAPLTLKKP